MDNNQNNRLANRALIVALVAYAALLFVAPLAILLVAAGILLVLAARGDTEPDTPGRSLANTALILSILVVVWFVRLIVFDMTFHTRYEPVGDTGVIETTGTIDP